LIKRTARVKESQAQIEIMNKKTYREPSMASNQTKLVNIGPKQTRKRLLMGIVMVVVGAGRLRQNRFGAGGELGTPCCYFG
jgi:hypothetical protein